ncbi:Uncharacterised protein [Legionella pneumophila]|nr:Uncharacterised protein [Legionella pneumophila]
MVAIGTGVTVTATVAVLVLLPLMPTLVGPSAAGAVKVIVQLAPIARLAPHVVLCTLMLLPPGMVAATFSAGSGEPILLVTVTNPLFPATKFKEDGFTVIVAPVAGPRVMRKILALLGR